MDTAHWPQDIGLVKPMEELISSTSSSFAANNAAAILDGSGRPPQPLMGGGERRARPQKEQILNCPRCNSTNTKFCYYNNYSLTQPRYFCKACRRYWTEGGSLRNVPVGGGSRKNKRSSTSSNSASWTASSAATSTAGTASACSTKTVMPEQNPKFHEGQDLNLAFPLSEFGNASANVPASASGALSAMELLRSSGIQGRSLNPFVGMHPMTMPEYHPSSGFGVEDFRTNSLSFPLDGSASCGGYGGLQECSTGMILFPFEESRPVVSSSGGGGHRGGDDAPPPPPPPAFWNGLMGSGGGGGSSW